MADMNQVPQGQPQAEPQAEPQAQQAQVDPEALVNRINDDLGQLVVVVEQQSPSNAGEVQHLLQSYQKVIQNISQGGAPEQADAQQSQGAVPIMAQGAQPKI